VTTYTRSEIERAFADFQAAAAHACETGDWTRWADCFTEDAEYHEHHYGHFEGRAAILEWITTTMAQPINRDMVAFPAEWYVIDEARGWVVCAIWNVMRDPGDGSVHREINWTKLHYAGDGKFSYEEDVYNPMEFGTMVEGWLAARRRVAGDA
jgi:hypothetical protein